MAIVSALHRSRSVIAVFLLITLFIAATPALPVERDAIDPAAYLSFNEGSGITAYDLSGHGNAGTLYNVTRIGSGGCGGALVFDGIDSYVSIPWRSTNHPEKEITVSGWIYSDAYGPQQIISTCSGNGGWCLGIGDGNDLWWTVYTREDGEVSVNVQHEGIEPRKWHYVAGIYDGKSVRIYIDGVLRNSANATGLIRYETPNYVILGAAAGAADAPDPACPQYFYGGLDEVRIYDTAVPYTQIMDDRFRCSQEPAPPSSGTAVIPVIIPACTAPSGSFTLAPGQSIERILVVPDRNTTGIWKVSMQPGSKITVMARDRYSSSNPDSWYIEVADEKGRIDRTVAFPNTRNSPVDALSRSGNVTVTARYFDGRERFPASVALRFDATTQPPPSVEQPVQTVFNYPIIVIYSASWATLIALVLVFLWLHKRSQDRKLAGQAGQKPDEPQQEEKRED